MFWVLLTALVVVATGTAYLSIRSFRDYVYFSIHADEPIQPWMHLGFVAHSYHLPPFVLEKAIGLPYGPPPDHRPLGRIAREKGVSFDTLKAKLENAIVHARPPYPPPGPPPPRASGAAR
jgi:hypothetical protein